MASSGSAWLFQAQALSSRLLDARSGLLGVSASSSDMAKLLAEEAQGDPNAHGAIEMFCYRVRKYVGAYVAVLGRVDAIMFGGGWLIHRLTYRRTNHDNRHVRGYIEEGTTTTRFDLVMMNNLDRYHLVMDVIDRVPGLGPKAAHVRQLMADTRLRARQYTRSMAKTCRRSATGYGRQRPDEAVPGVPIRVR